MVRLMRSAQAGLLVTGFSPSAHSAHVADIRGQDGVVRANYDAGPPVTWKSLLVEEDSPASLDVIVTVGLAVVDGKPIERETVVTVTFTDQSNDQYDLIEIDKNGVISTLADNGEGEAASSGKEALADIHLTSGITEIPTANITDRRTLV